MAIPVVLVYFIRRRKDIPYPWLFWLFGAFIIGCGTTHLMEVITTYAPVYRLSGLIKLLTAAVSLVTAITLVPLVPKALALRRPKELEREIEERKRAEQALRASEEHFRLLVEGTRDYGIFMLDPQGRVTSWNTGAQRITGYSREEIVGQHFSRFYTDEANERGWPERELEKAAAEGRLEDEGWRTRKDGALYWANVIITALRDERGNLHGFLKITRDLTEFKRAADALQESEARFRAVAQTASEGIVSADAAGNIVFWNKGAQTIFGYNEQEVLGQPFALLMPDRHQDAHRTGLQRFQATGEASVIGKTVELDGRRKDGTEFPLDVSLSTWKTEEGTFYTGIIRDITARKRAEEVILRLNAELNEESLETLEANKELEAFSYSVSHDLRAPLRAIDGFSRILLEDDAARQPDRLHHYLRLVRSNAQQMGQLIDALLSFSRLGRQPLKKQPVAPDELVRQVLTDLRGDQSGGRRVTVRLADLPACQADPVLLKQVFTNLLDNALKYTRKRDEAVIEIGARVNGEEAGEPVYFIKDNGEGFDMRYVDKLFRVFQRLHRAEDYEGTGVGLATVQRIVHRHGGRVWAEAENGRGATFYFTLGGRDAND